MDFKRLTNFKDIIELDRRVTPCDDRDTFNISWGIDKNYQTGAAISIASILENNKQNNINFTFHIIADYLDQEYIVLLTQLAEQYKTVIKLYHIDSEPLVSLPKTNIWPVSIYYRLLSFDYFSERLDRLLYLDADITCKGSLEDLAALKFDGEYGAVVVDVDSMQDKSAERLHNPEFKGNYFNSGVMYINLQQWLNSNLTKKFFELLSDESIVSRVKYPDQDILNIMFLHHAVLLPRKYNSIYSLKSEFEIKNKNYYKSVINEETVFIHYTGVTKPWHEWADYSSAQFFRTVYENSPWKNQPYQVAKQKHEYREEYKHLLYQNKIIPGLIAAIKYKTM
ncbi:MULTISPECIES: glycosyltransferase family 8 protein [Citrobacter]|uniref:glycosyltransferase family 8 protein n=1 Tax=Citrobacter TaxID=544 RepID=UPI000CDDAAC8|nr:MULTISPECIES: glycosyltransferase [Citrobacter]EGT0622796.1 glycosyltransferase family 8 protein [Citrobacter braakii]EGT0645889.1 glycosyltransferase family 8 protein [Citrobacter braakii]EHG7888120.1 glycosyltransferase family 8 protein [Citrobacter braakii]MBJ8849278.1 glycosyltransferase family 8 protein [Citrobacter braakii]MBJ9146457.1 glycosyltransferase family 8 protein [Citrobacter braakii]